MIVYAFLYILAVQKTSVTKSCKVEKAPYIHISELYLTEHDCKRTNIYAYNWYLKL